MDQIVHFLHKPIRFHGQINSKKNNSKIKKIKKMDDLVHLVKNKQLYLFNNNKVSLF